MIFQRFQQKKKKKKKKKKNYDFPMVSSHNLEIENHI